MRALSLLLAATVFVTGCDNGILVRGLVTDHDGDPVGEAWVAVADRVSNDNLDAYLKGDATVMPPFGRNTDSEGRFSQDKVLGGDGFHDVWLVVRKDGFLDHAEQVWAGHGGPDRDFYVEVILQPEEEEEPQEAPLQSPSE